MRKEGIIKLSDRSILKLSIMIIDAKEVGFSPFGGVNIAVKPIGGVAPLEVPETVKELVKDKPLASPELPQDGWELIDIIDHEPAIDEYEVYTSKGKFKVTVEAEPVMAARNINYKSGADEPIYWLNWVYKISWKPVKEQGELEPQER
ncbi:hypothetical protein [Geoglobus acetivorans]|uniref:hypothetical protein n=1 Tax=Geoglobus acetivorans TaxID=565033 RepID=UPI001930B774